MQRRVQPDFLQRAEIKLLHIGGVRLQHDLKLIIMLKAVRVLAIAPVTGAAAGLHKGGAPIARTQRAQRGGGVKRARPHLHVIRLQDHTALLGPIGLQGQDQILESQLLGFGVCHGTKNPGKMRAEPTIRTAH